MIRIEAVLFLLGYSLIVAFLGFLFYFAWFRGESYQRVAYKLYSNMFGSYLKTKRYLWEQRLAITLGPVLVLAFGLGLLLKLVGD
jgi:hypothetical protein